jgi:hypothetical protein
MSRSSNDPRFDFEATPTLEDLIRQQGKKPIQNPGTLHGDFWPEDEPVEDFLAALDEWRGHLKADRAA